MLERLGKESARSLPPPAAREGHHLIPGRQPGAVRRLGLRAVMEGRLEKPPRRHGFQGLLFGRVLFVKVVN